MKPRILHVITRLDRGGSATNTLLTVAGFPDAFDQCLVYGRTHELPPLARAVRQAEELPPLVWRIGVCIHAGLHGKKAKRIPLEISTAERALAIADWFGQQQLQILSESRAAAARKVTAKIFELLAKNPAGIRAADVYRARIAKDATEARTILARMEADHALLGHDRTPLGGGHVTRVYFRNPAYEF